MIICLFGIFLDIVACTFTCVVSLFLLKNYCLPKGKLRFIWLPWLVTPLKKHPDRIFRVPELFQRTELPVVSPRPNKFHPITEGLIIYMHIQQSSPCFIVHTTVKHGPSRLLEPTWRILLVRLYKAKLPSSFGVNSSAEKIHLGQFDVPTSW